MKKTLFILSCLFILGASQTALASENIKPTVEKVTIIPYGPYDGF